MNLLSVVKFLSTRRIFCWNKLYLWISFSIVRLFHTQPSHKARKHGTAGAISGIWLHGLFWPALLLVVWFRCMQAEQPTVYSLHDTMYGRINVDPRQSVLFWHHLEDLCMFPNKVLVSCCPSVAQGVKPFSTEGACGNKIQQRPLRKNLPSTAVPEREKKS